MIFTRKVSCTGGGDFGGDGPEVLSVEVGPELIDRIRELAVEVERLGVYAIELFDSHAYWYEADWEKTDHENDDAPPVAGDEFTSLDCETLHVSNDDFWWEAWLKGADIRVSCEPISISELAI